MTEIPCSWREEVRPADVSAIRRLCLESGFFSPDEVDIAAELVDERLIKGPASGYFFLLAEDGPDLLGYTCYGPIAGTKSSWDLFWIVVAKNRQGLGLGRLLQAETEARIRAAGGERIIAWTSSRDQYRPTRAFYEALGYVQEAFLKDYYSPGDGAAIYVKTLT